MAPSGSVARDAVPVSCSRPPISKRSRKAGDRIAGKYVLVRMLGKGGMGSVWQARNDALGSDVAIKLLLPSSVTDEASERLLREARAAALIEHPGIVRVFDFGRSEEGEPYIVMEMLRGTSLADLFDARGRIPAKVAVQLVLPVVSALAVAHTRGVIHRDLKPENVMLVVTPQGGVVVPKIVDFGIAKLTHEESRPLTRDGAVLGSPNYMAPEQARGAADVDERADVWALCVVLYEAITGVRPFEAGNNLALLYSILTADPVPTTDFAAGDPELWDVISRGLEKQLHERWPSMRDLGVALAEWAAARDIHADVTGNHIDHQWLGGARVSAVLDLPTPSRQRAVAPSDQGVAWHQNASDPAAHAATAEQSDADVTSARAMARAAGADEQAAVHAPTIAAGPCDAALSMGADFSTDRSSSAPPVSRPRVRTGSTDRRRVGLMFAAAVLALASFNGTRLVLSSSGSPPPARPAQSAVVAGAETSAQTPQFVAGAPPATAQPGESEPSSGSSADRSAHAPANRQLAPEPAAAPGVAPSGAPPPRPLPLKRRAGVMPLPAVPDF